MSRIVLQVVLPLIAPVVIYWLWAYATQGRRNQGVPGWEEGHWFYAILLGFALAFASFGYLAWSGFDSAGGKPPPVHDTGPVEPGRYR